MLISVIALGAWLGRRTWGPAFVAVGAAGLVLLWPTLSLPDGIPSPASSLGSHAPWQTVDDPADGNPVLQDVTYQVHPWLIFQRAELRAGRLPFWNPYQMAGVPHWANGSSAPLFPLHLLFVLLPDPIGWTILAWARLVLGGMGAFALCRELGTSRRAALLGGLTFSMAAMPVGFLLYPMGNAISLAPWVLLTTERLASGRGGVAPLGIATGLQLLGGHPGTSFHTALVSCLYLLVRGAPREADTPTLAGPTRLAGRYVAGWCCGFGLAGVHLLPLLEYLPRTSRWLAPADRGSIPLRVFLEQLLRFLYPSLYGNPAGGTWFGPFNYLASGVYVGALAIPLAIAGATLAIRVGDRRRIAFTTIVAVAAIIAYPLPGLTRLMGRLPLVGIAPPHRLLLFVQLGLAVLAAAGLDVWLTCRDSRVIRAGGVIVVGIALAMWISWAPTWDGHGLIGEELVRTVILIALVAMIAAPLRPRTRARLTPALLLLVVVDLASAHASINPGIPLRRLYPETGATRFLSGKEGRVIATGETFRPDAGTVYRIPDVRGDDSLRPSTYTRFHRRALGPLHPTYFSRVTRWRQETLDWLGVGWILTGPREAAPLRDWSLAYDGDDARVWRNPTPVHSVHVEPPDAGTVRLERPEPGRLRLRWSLQRSATLVVPETFVPGWRASAGVLMPFPYRGGRWLAIRAAAGSGGADLVYTPPLWTASWLLSSLTVLGLVGILRHERRMRPPGDGAARTALS